MVNQPVKKQNQRTPDGLVGGEEVLKLQDPQGSSQVFKHFLVVLSSELHRALQHVAEGKLGNVRGAVEQWGEVMVMEAPVRGDIQDTVKNI